MSRHLSMVERRVTTHSRMSYLALLPARKASASEAEANFWVFEHATESDRFLEFVEASEPSLVAKLAEVSPDSLWRAVEVT